MSNGFALTRLREITAEHRRLDDEAAHLLEQLAAAAPEGAAHETAEFVTAKEAAHLCGKSRSWMYANGEKHKLGFRTASRSWSFYADRCAAFRAGALEACESWDSAGKIGNREDFSNDPQGASCDSDIP
jgi:hypothetical protein